MTFWYDSTANELVENSSGDTEWHEETEEGFKLDVDEMPPRKLTNIINAAEAAFDANNDDAETSP